MLSIVQSIFFKQVVVLIFTADAKGVYISSVCFRTDKTKCIAVVFMIIIPDSVQFFRLSTNVHVCNSCIHQVKDN